MKKYITITALLGFVLSTVVPAQAEDVPCLIEPEETVEIGSPVTGLLNTLEVERGDTVDEGETIATLKSSVENRNLALAKARATDFSELRSAKKAAEHAALELKRAKAMFAKQLVSQQALDKARTEATLAKLQFEQAKANLEQARLEQKLAESRLAQRTIISPIRGIVAERYATPGQRVQDQPLVKLIKTDPLKVEVIAPAKYYGQFTVGDVLKVAPQLKGLPEKRAMVTIVDHIIDTASNTFRLTLSLPNEDKAIPPGARCSVQLDGDHSVALNQPH
ncbi:MAG: efflux RND transporter periplasmic adaptor subunit [bacterium]